MPKDDPPKRDLNGLSQMQDWILFIQVIMGVIGFVLILGLFILMFLKVIV